MQLCLLLHREKSKPWSVKQRDHHFSPDIADSGQLCGSYRSQVCAWELEWVTLSYGWMLVLLRIGRYENELWKRIPWSRGSGWTHQIPHLSMIPVWLWPTYYLVLGFHFPFFLIFILHIISMTWNTLWESVNCICKNVLQQEFLGKSWGYIFEEWTIYVYFQMWSAQAAL